MKKKKISEDLNSSIEMLNKQKKKSIYTID